jgi:hypothetical protein
MSLMRSALRFKHRKAKVHKSPGAEVRQHTQSPPHPVFISFLLVTRDSGRAPILHQRATVRSLVHDVAAMAAGGRLRCAECDQGRRTERFVSFGAACRARKRKLAREIDRTIGRALRGDLPESEAGNLEYLRHARRSPGSKRDGLAPPSRRPGWIFPDLPWPYLMTNSAIDPRAVALLFTARVADTSVSLKSRA